jgi:hypothetical protein
MADEVEDDSAERSLFPVERERWSDALCAVDHRRKIARRTILDIDPIDDLRTSDVPLAGRRLEVRDVNDHAFSGLNALNNFRNKGSIQNTQIEGVVGKKSHAQAHNLSRQQSCRSSKDAAQSRDGRTRRRTQASQR